MSSILEKFKTRMESFVKTFLNSTQKKLLYFPYKKINAARQQTLDNSYVLSQQEYDAFRMKAIVLLKKGSMLGMPIRSLLTDPIEVQIGSEGKQRLVVKLSQRFEWSGRVYHLHGEFLRHLSKKKVHSIPLPATFRIIQDQPINQECKNNDDP